MVEKDIPAYLEPEARKRREELLDEASMFCDELMEAVMDDSVTEELIYRAVRNGTIRRELTPVFIGSAYRNKGVQPLMDAVVDYLPNPSEVENFALDLDRDEEPVKLIADDDAPLVALAFKLEEGQYGQLTYIRIYQGSIKKGDEVYNSRSRKKLKIGRLIRMHSDSMEDIQGATAGDIVALFGIDCASGDTFVHPSLNYSMTSMYVPTPVISLSLKAADRKSEGNMAKALNRFTKEDPTFKTHVDPESNETIIQGMGELHLDVYVERMRREYKAAVETGQPQVAYRETISRLAEFDYTHKKQTGGSGQFARIAGYIEPFDEGEYDFVNEVKGGAIPTEFIPSCDKGFRSALTKGDLIGFPITGVRVVINDGTSHSVDSSDIAFQQAAIGAFREVYKKAAPKILEPIMKVTVEAPTEFQGNVFGSLNQRRGVIISTQEEVSFFTVDAEVPLSEMFGFSTALRSLSQGKAEFSMEFLKYGRVPVSITEELIETLGDKKK